MTHRLRSHTQHNHPPLESDELGFHAHERATPATEQLGNTIDTADENGDESNNDGANKIPEAVGFPDGKGRVRKLVAALVGAKAVFADEGAEDKKD
jgi:hypothetical protein